MKLGYRLSVFGYWLLVLLIGGCATVGEGTKCLAGVSTKVLEENRKTALVKTISLDYPTAYAKTLEILKQAGTYLYAQGVGKYMVAVYLSANDTTPVGVFFKETGANSTQIEVSSPSTYAKELIAAKLFPALENTDAGAP